MIITLLKAFAYVWACACTIAHLSWRGLQVNHANSGKKFLCWESVEEIPNSKRSCKCNKTKFISNKQVIKLISDDRRKSNVRNELVSLGNLPQEKALGVKWDTQNDTLSFYIKLSDKSLTRHGLLSTLSSVYDPGGLGVPFLLKGDRSSYSCAETGWIGMNQ